MWSRNFYGMMLKTVLRSLLKLLVKENVKAAEQANEWGGPPSDQNFELPLGWRAKKKVIATSSSHSTRIKVSSNTPNLINTAQLHTQGRFYCYIRVNDCSIRVSWSYKKWEVGGTAYVLRTIYMVYLTYVLAI